jgi:hypothetical protein
VQILDVPQLLGEDEAELTAVHFLQALLSRDSALKQVNRES